MPLVPVKQFKQPRVSAAARVAQPFIMPAPTGGLNYRDPISNMSPNDALVLDNFIPTQTGVQLRKGWKYTSSTVSLPIRSIFTFNAPDPTDNKIFAAAGGNIYDVTGSTPVQVVTGTSSENDQWSVTQFSTNADMFLLAVSPGAGYWTYDTTNGWVNQTPTNLPTDLTSVAVWKRRVWFTEKESSKVWYLDTVDAITGTAVSFQMGSLLRNGGFVRGLINWTLDAGVGVDDHLVVVGSQGDVGVWQGTDPSDAATFRLQGVWYVGPVPTYGRFFTGYGGDVMIVSTLGLVPVSRLVNGQFSEIQPGPSQKIQSVLVPLVSQLKDELSWDVFVVPDSDVLVIKLPENAGVYQQFAMNVNTGAWCTFSGMLMACCALLNGQLYFGTEDGRVARGLFGTADGVETDGSGANAIEGDVQTAFNAFGTPAQLKKFGLARPIFIAPAAPSVKVQVNTQFTFANTAGSPSFSETVDSRWNQSNWNVARWVGSNNSYQAWIGTTGLGYYGSLRMRVRGLSGTIFTSAHMMTELGGVI